MDIPVRQSTYAPLSSAPSKASPDEGFITSLMDIDELSYRLKGAIIIDKKKAAERKRIKDEWEAGRPARELAWIDAHPNLDFVQTPNKPKRKSVTLIKDVPAGMKQCHYCGEIKPLTEFHMRAAARDGHTTICKSCKNKTH